MTKEVDAKELDQEPEDLETEEDQEEPEESSESDEQDDEDHQEPEAEEESEEDDSVTVSLGDEDTPASDEEDDDKARPWVRELRKNNKEKDRKIRELEEKLKAATEVEKAKVELGPKPTLAGCDYDEEKFEADLESWHQRKRVVAEEERKAKESEEEQQKAFKERQELYSKRKSELKVKDFEDAELTVSDSFSPTQQGIVVGAANDAALFVYALGKNPKRLAELSAIKDPVKFAYEVGKLETQLKVTPTKKAPLPEKTLRGSASTTAVVDSKMARLEAEAERTGDRTKILAYRRELRAKGK